MTLFKSKKRLGATRTHKIRYRTANRKRTRKPVKPSRQKFIPPNSPKAKLGVKFKRLSFLVLAGILCIALFYFLFLSSFFVIETTKVTFKEEPEKQLNQALTAYVDTLRQQNIILLSSLEITQTLLQKHPEIARVKVKKIFPRRVQIEITPFPMVANLIHKTNGFEKKYLLNQTGRISQKNIENPNLPYILYQSEEELTLGNLLLPEKQLNFILTAVDNFTILFNMNVFDAKYLPIEREIHLRTEKYFHVWLDLSQDLDKQLNKLKRALPSLDIYQLPLEYIDLRISSINGEEVIYKER